MEVECNKVKGRLDKVLTILILKVAAFVFFFIFISNAYALEIYHGDKVIKFDNPNFTFAKSIWTNTGMHPTYNNLSDTNYLFIDDIRTPGTLQISLINAPISADVYLYRLKPEGSYIYTTVLLKKFNGLHNQDPESVIKSFYEFYYTQPDNYFIEVYDPSHSIPHINLDFYPDDQGIKDTDGNPCMPLVPDNSGISCSESWLPAFYRREIDPSLRARISQIKKGLGKIDTIHDEVEAANDLINKALETALLPGQLHEKFFSGKNLYK